MSTPTLLRPATPGEAGLLSELAIRSKAYWGCSADFLDACRADLTVDPADCDGASVGIAERSGEPLGSWRLAPTDGPPRGELADPFVDAEAIGTGVGRRLLDDALAQARASGWHALQFGADPQAEDLYRHLGAERVGCSDSTRSSAGKRSWAAVAHTSLRTTQRLRPGGRDRWSIACAVGATENSAGQATEPSPIGGRALLQITRIRGRRLRTRVST